MMRPGAGGVPNPDDANFATSTSAGEFIPVDVVEGPDGAIYIPNYLVEEIVRIRYPPRNAPPVARLDATRPAATCPCR